MTSSFKIIRRASVCFYPKASPSGAFAQRELTSATSSTHEACSSLYWDSFRLCACCSGICKFNFAIEEDQPDMLDIKSAFGSYSRSHSNANFSLDTDTAAHALFGVRPDYRDEVLKLHRFGDDEMARILFIKALEEKGAYKVLDELERQDS
ncbi:hypothetical protein E3P89_04140 [Wallemia ichthyophaga]|uniref:Uncharacterized protein n=1 Tax=Wallemia ichthyophaga TaxID=245174 RepID=A0A4T0GWR5_WALIC|nr:hypothetical protein E3P93_04145 [Wallemia ichthyophaga]TIB07026.1 hypothetical protein E3P90_04154 [Wallemia ichthyophaga]TIB19110.1 hypothetical protein E3P89_04140 [Wallemia ichthyophaga]TIB19591.1 hypothetical protein E3P88_04149 [Wallemia ichthyophaga]